MTKEESFYPVYRLNVPTRFLISVIYISRSCLGPWIGEPERHNEVMVEVGVIQGKVRFPRVSQPGERELIVPMRWSEDVMTRLKIGPDLSRYPRTTDRSLMSLMSKRRFLMSRRPQGVPTGSWVSGGPHPPKWRGVSQYGGMVRITGPCQNSRVSHLSWLSPGTVMYSPSFLTTNTVQLELDPTTQSDGP